MEQFVRLDGGDLLDLLLDAREQLSVAGHYFPNYSFGPTRYCKGNSKHRRGYRRPVSARRRVVALVALVSAVAVAVVAVAVVSAGDGSGRAPTTAGTPRPGTAATVVRSRIPFRSRGALSCTRPGALSAGADRGRTRALRAPRLARSEGRARVHVVARWRPRPPRAARELYPESAVVQFHLGLARFWAEAATRWPRGARWRTAPDSPYAILAGTSCSRISRAGACIRSVVLGACGGDSPARSRQLRAPRGAPSAAARASGSCTASASSASGGPSRPRRRSSELPSSRRTTPRRWSRPPSGRSTRSIRSRIRPARAPDQNVPAGAAVRFHLGVLLLGTGRVDMAIRQLRLASRTEPGLTACARGGPLP